MAKQKQDNKTIDIELLIVRDKIKELICNYENGRQYCDINALYWHNCIIKDLKSLLEM